MNRIRYCLLVLDLLVLWAIPSVGGSQGPCLSDKCQKISYKTDSDLSMQDVFRVGGGLVVAIAIALGALVVLKRYAGSHIGTAGSRISLIEVRRLTPKTTVFLIEADGIRMLLGQQHDQLTVLHTYERGQASVERP